MTNAQKLKQYNRTKNVSRKLIHEPNVPCNSQVYKGRLKNTLKEKLALTMTD